LSTTTGPRGSSTSLSGETETSRVWISK
jgi:hypothetical protein